MKVRARLALTGVAALIPVAATLVLAITSLRTVALAGVLVQTAEGIATAGHAACVADPVGWSGELVTGIEVHAYDPELRPADADAPTLAPTLVAAATAGTPQLHRIQNRGVVLVHASPTGPCAYILVTRVIPGPGPSPMGPLWLIGPLVCCVMALVVVLVLLGPIVRRISRLRDEVRTAAASGYRTDITVRGDDELAELAAAFAHSSRQLNIHLDAQERRERTLREFLANTTHDVMLPLTVLQGHLAALHGGPPDATTLRAAMQEADYIAALVHNLEIAARLDAGEPSLADDPVELAPLVARVSQRHAPLARRRGIHLAHAVPNHPIVVRGDLTLIEQAVSNLVQNAVLHNHQGGHVAVVLELDDTARFRVVVKDDGPGLAPAELERVLSRGERGDDARTRHPHGKGLGLSIARRVADAHRWSFTMRPGSDAGLEVELRGPIA
jgi:signal transduction histidine kinase